jgi:hypothetical protein
MLDMMYLDMIGLSLLSMTGVDQVVVDTAGVMMFCVDATGGDQAILDLSTISRSRVSV